jgi:hypothetical protein
MIAGFVRGGLRYLPVLAIQAMEITPSHSDGESLGPWVKMEKRLFFHRVYIDRTRVSKRDSVKFSININFGSTSPSVRRHNNTLMRASLAPHHAIFQFLVKIGFFDVRIFRRKRFLGKGGIPRPQHGPTGDT